MSSGSEVAPTSPGASARRKSSGIMPSYDGLQQLRSNGEARRQSMNDQQIKPGFFSQFFHNTFGKNAK